MLFDLILVKMLILKEL